MRIYFHLAVKVHSDVGQLLLNVPQEIVSTLMD